jgi:multidrug efflux pump subunit AcrA (membrane-fusion protein)
MGGVKRPARLRRPPLPRRPLEWGLAIVAVALVAIAITSLGTSSSSSSAATKRTATVGKGVVQSTVSGNGTLEPARKVELSFGASGEVTAIKVKAGEKVTKGQVLAEVDSSSARASLASAEAQLIEAEEAVESAAEAEAEASEEVAYEGGARTVFVGLMSEDGTGAAKAEEEVTAPAKGKEEAKEEQPEAAEEPSSESSAPTSGGGSETGSGSETGGGATLSLPTAEANLREAELSVKSARQEVRETTLRAPISGTIASVSGAVGETVSGGSSSGNSEASSPVATGDESSGGSESFMVLAQLQRLKMEVSFSEADIGEVREGQTATVAIDSMEGTELAGRVTKVSVLPGEGSSGVVEYPATILLTQSAKGLRAGMSASAEVVVEQVKNALTVPSEAISQAADGKTVTVEEDGKEATKTVTIGLAGDETTEVVSGVKAGQTLVLPEATVAAASGAEGESGATKELGGAGGSTFAFPGGGATGGPPSGFGGP